MKIFRWVVGIFFVLAAVAYLTESIPTSIFSALLAVLLLPPLSSLVQNKLKMVLSRNIKIVVGIVFFIGLMMVAPSSKTKTIVQTPSPSPTATRSITPSATTKPSPTISKTLYPVVKVVDGDTLDVRIDGKTARIRLIGIDTPEVVDPRRPVQCFGKEASDKAKQVLTGKQISLESDSTQDDKDKYGRLLKYAFLEDGTNFNKMMIVEGYAHEYTYQIPYKYQSEFKQAEKDARNGNKGLWNPKACSTPSPTRTPTIVQQIYVQPTTAYNAPTNPPAAPQNTTSSGAYTCDCSRACTVISSCDEAQYQLNNCGCSQRDADHDGIACDGAPLHCQN